MTLNASDYYTYHRPSKCELRVNLLGKGVIPSDPSEYELVLRRLGDRHEETHLDSLMPDVLDLRDGSISDRIERTVEAVGNQNPIIYQAVFQRTANVNGAEREIIGEPDFLILEGDGYVIRDCKISRRTTKRDHPEIIYQMQLYGWLYEQTFGSPPARLEVLAGTGDVAFVDYDGGNAALNELSEIAAYLEAEIEPISPVGWTKCGGCGYRERCWPRAEENRDVALLYGVDSGLAQALYAAGINSYDELLKRFDESALSEFQRPWGKGTRKVGKSAANIIRSANAMASGEVIVVAPPPIPNNENCVMFDLEGLPPQMDELEKIYLWGAQIFGQEPSEYMAAVAGFGDDGDRKGWFDFLHNAQRIFDAIGDIPFVHWHHYEKTKLNLYLDRFGDKGGVAERVKRNLVDLLPITQQSLVLPLPSYSLKVVEQYAGFKRSQEEYGGDWSMARYIEAVETHDEKLRQDVMDQILLYNREDLEATWAVFRWLQDFRGLDDMS